MKIYICIQLLFLAITIGYYKYTEPVPSSSASLDVEELIKSEQRRQSIFSAMDFSLRTEERKKSNRGPAAIPRAPEVLKWNDREKNLMNAFDTEKPIGNLILNSLVADLHGQGREEGVLMHEKLKDELQKSPLESLEIIHNALKKMPFEEYPMEKAALLALAVKELYPGKKAMKEIALDQLQTNVTKARMRPEQALTEEEMENATSPHREMFLPVIAYEAFIGVSDDPEMAIQETISILNLQEDYAVRNTIVEAFNNKFPKYEKKLEQKIGEYGIEVLYYKQQIAGVEPELENQEKDNDNLLQAKLINSD